MATGLLQYNSSVIPGFSAAVAPDRNYLRNRTPRVLTVKFGDGYEQRKPQGINNFDETYNISFVNRPDAEMDDLEAFFTSLNGVSKFRMVIPNTNLSPGEESIVVVCDSWTISNPQDTVRSINANIRRVYEP